MISSFCRCFRLLVFNDGPTVQGVEFWGGKEMPFYGTSVSYAGLPNDVLSKILLLITLRARHCPRVSVLNLGYSLMAQFWEKPWNAFIRASIQIK